MLRCSFGADIAGVANVVAGNGDTSSIGVSLLGANFADNIAVADFFETIWWHVSKVDDMEGIGAVNWICCGIFAAETLAKTSKFFGIGGAPELLICRSSRDSPVSWSRMAATMQAVVVEVERVVCATLASMTWLTQAEFSRAAARVREQERRAMGSQRLGAFRMSCNLVWDKTGLGCKVG